MNIAYTVQKIDAAGLADARRRSMYRLSALVDSELRKPAGQRSRLTYADFSERLAGSPHGVTEHCWVAWTGRGQAIGIAWLTLRASAEFEAVGKVDIAVAAACRRRGLGSALLADIHSWAAGNGLDTLYSWAGVSSAGAGFLAARMERFRDEELWSVLDLARIDLDALESRTAQPPSAGLQAVGWYGPCPADLLETYASCHRRIGATARGSEADSRHVSAGLLADLEAAAVRAGESWLTVAAVTETGDVVGFSQITLPSDEFGRAEQAYTGVVPEWRGRGVAGWLKAAVLVRLLKQAAPVPARFLTTENNGGNTAILAANARLGFEPYIHWSARETTVARVS